MCRSYRVGRNSAAAITAVRGSALLSAPSPAGHHRQKRTPPSSSIDQFGKDPLEISRHSSRRNMFDVSSTTTSTTSSTECCSTLFDSLRSFDGSSSRSTGSSSNSPTVIDEDMSPSILDRYDEVVVNTNASNSMTAVHVSKPSQPSKSSKTVSFDQVNIREYPVTIGDHPDVGMGCPVTMSWEYHQFPPTDVDAHEAVRGRQRKSPTQMRMHPNARLRMMLAAGISREEIVAATREANRVRQKRICTENLDFLPLFTKVEVFLQSVKRKIKRRSWRSRAAYE